MTNANQPLSVETETMSPHDLLVIVGAGDLVANEDLVENEPPAWVRGALTRAPFVVVRRAPVENGLIPVGVRGAHRGERAAALLPAVRVLKRITPESLAQSQAWATAARARDLPHFAVLRDAAEILDASGLCWGPAGGMGFELASGSPCLTASSDIDLVLRAPKPLKRPFAAQLRQSLSNFSIRIDVQVEIPAGAIALAEYASGVDRIVLRTKTGPRLVAGPWEEVK